MIPGRERVSRARRRLIDLVRRAQARPQPPVLPGPRATRDDVRVAYRLLLGREPDPEGFAFWIAKLGTMQATELARHLLHSVEYRQRWLAQLGPAADFAKPDAPPPTWSPLASQLVTQAQVDSVLYWRWCDEIGEAPRHHRKQWEYVYLLQALDSAGMLAPGTCGLGFGVGREPTVSVLAKRACRLLVTDLAADAAARGGWRGSLQHSSSLGEIHHPEICDHATFRAHVEHRVQDMRAIDADLKRAGFDFVWSLCALEHLGSLEEGLRFVRESLACVRPGGLAVHTTEFNVSSDDATIERGPTVLYRRRDVEVLARELAREGHDVQLNLHPGDGPLDRHYDVPPYASDVQMKIQVGAFVTTSLGLVIRARGG
ncbi:MAG: methyltransferase domain-containing protein [Deltaproteobacteria bacterium]|nr:methyltransferase domain-containing protein [Deltaproteobacteria bacterium]